MYVFEIVKFSKEELRKNELDWVMRGGKKKRQYKGWSSEMTFQLLSRADPQVTQILIVTSAFQNITG